MRNYSVNTLITTLNSNIKKLKKNIEEIIPILNKNEQQKIQNMAKTSTNIVKIAEQIEEVLSRNNLNKLSIIKSRFLNLSKMYQDISIPVFVGESLELIKLSKDFIPNAKNLLNNNNASKKYLKFIEQTENILNGLLELYNSKSSKNTITDDFIEVIFNLVGSIIGIVLSSEKNKESYNLNNQFNNTNQLIKVILGNGSNN
jgi:hypothetical protein